MSIQDERQVRLVSVRQAFIDYALDNPEILEILNTLDASFLDPKLYKQTGKGIRDLSVAWLLSMENWRHFVTLTFRFDVHPDQARFAWRDLVRELNREVFGLHYYHTVGHSYFSYVLGMEYQKRGVAHFHVVVSSFINYQKIHDYWGSKNGFANIQKIDDVNSCVAYVAKYMLKGGDILPYMASANFKPLVKPFWWNE